MRQAAAGTIDMSCVDTGRFTVVVSCTTCLDQCQITDAHVAKRQRAPVQCAIIHQCTVKCIWFYSRVMYSYRNCKITIVFMEIYIILKNLHNSDRLVEGDQLDDSRCAVNIIPTLEVYLFICCWPPPRYMHPIDEWVLFSRSANKFTLTDTLIIIKCNDVLDSNRCATNTTTDHYLRCRCTTDMDGW